MRCPLETGARQPRVVDDSVSRRHSLRLSKTFTQVVSDPITQVVEDVQLVSLRLHGMFSRNCCRSISGCIRFCHLGRRTRSVDFTQVALAVHLIRLRGNVGMCRPGCVICSPDTTLGKVRLVSNGSTQIAEDAQPTSAGLYKMFT